MISPIDRARYDALLFDMDGVLTDTAAMHAACWKQVFDGFLAERARRFDEILQPFEIATDYAVHVDGKARAEGVRCFLESRGITLPFGDPAAPPSDDSIWGLANRKNGLVTTAIAEGGAQGYPGSVALLRQARSQGFKTAVVSASTNCAAVLQGVGIVDLFDARVDGVVAAERRLGSKPAPDMFLAAAEALAVGPERAVVFEDAIAGVQAGRAGGFGLVVGVDRLGDPNRLAQNGANVVVADLAEFLDRQTR